MSPEQARGKVVDKRTDIWAFGCVLYEMLSGQPAFKEDTISDTIAAIIGREPKWDALGGSTPSRIRNLLHRCLHKDPTKRLRDIGDVRTEIDEALAHRARRRVPLVWREPLAAERVRLDLDRSRQSLVLRSQARNGRAHGHRDLD